MDQGPVDTNGKGLPDKDTAGSNSSSSAPPEATGAEQYFYRKHMQRRTAMVVVTLAGQRHRGWIEWYDRDVMKLHSLTEANLFLRKDEVKYMYRLGDDPAAEQIMTPPPAPKKRRGGRRRGGRRSGPGRSA